MDFIKICRKHGELTQENIFSTLNDKKNKIKLKCNICKKESCRKSYKKHREKISIKVHNLRKEKPELFRDRSKRYREKHKDKIKLKNKLNSEIRRKRWNDWYSRNKEKVRIQIKPVREKRKEKENKAMASYRKNNPLKVLNSALKAKYNITLDEYNHILEVQNNNCAICLKPETKKYSDGRIQKLSVDHCHKTNKIRGLLCFKCNLLIGNANDCTDRLYAAIKYLAQYQ